VAQLTKVLGSIQKRLSPNGLWYSAFECPFPKNNCVIFYGNKVHPILKTSKWGVDPFPEQTLRRRAELEKSVHILEEQAAQLQSSLNTHNEVLEEILFRLSRTPASGGGITSG
jgi:hypothetical protein